MNWDEPQSPRDKAKELAFDAMDASDDQQRAQLCRQALEIYPDCVDALCMLAEIECPLLKDNVPALRKAVEAGRRDLGEEYIERMKGVFWLEMETRPYMRALAGLADALIQCGQPERVDEAIDIYESMLELNPNDNQGVRDPLAACFLQRKLYPYAEDLLTSYGDDCMAVSCWAWVLLAYATGDEQEAAKRLREARLQNPHVEQYLTGQKRRPRSRSGFYSPGEDSEAVFCAETLWEAWKKHPEAKRWLKEKCTEEPIWKVFADSEDLLSDEVEEVDQVEETSWDSEPPAPLPFPTPPDESAGNEPQPPNETQPPVTEVPEAFRERFEAITARTDAFCDKHLNAEYKHLCREMALALCREDSPARKGKPESWAAGIVYALGQVNFLSDPAQNPHMKSDQIARVIGVSPATMYNKAKVIREGLGLMPLHPDWTLPSQAEDNPLIWMLEVNGLLIDIRHAPREVQEAAYEQGLIPHIPADENG